MPVQDLKKLLERIHLRLDESLVGIGAQVADLAAAAFNIDVLIDAGYSSTSPDCIGDKESKRLPRIPC